MIEIVHLYKTRRFAQGNQASLSVDYSNTQPSQMSNIQTYNLTPLEPRHYYVG